MYTSFYSPSLNPSSPRRSLYEPEAARGGELIFLYRQRF